MKRRERETTTSRSEGPLSRPLDKLLGRKADPEGGKVYDKRSAWAWAYHSLWIWR